MAEEPQPASVVEGADIEDENPVAKSAEDRKAQAALSKLDAKDDEESASKDVDQDAVNRAMTNLGGDAGKAEKKEIKKVKVDSADVALLVGCSIAHFQGRSEARFCLRSSCMANLWRHLGRPTRLDQTEGHRYSQEP